MWRQYISKVVTPTIMEKLEAQMGGAATKKSLAASREAKARKASKSSTPAKGAAKSPVSVKEAKAQSPDAQNQDDDQKVDAAELEKALMESAEDMEENTTLEESKEDVVPEKLSGLTDIPEPVQSNRPNLRSTPTKPQPPAEQVLSMSPEDFATAIGQGKLYEKEQTLLDSELFKKSLWHPGRTS